VKLRHRWAIALVGLAATACGAGLRPGQTIPQVLRHYEVLVEGRDSVARALADAFHRLGFKVRDHVRGGSGPVAAYLGTAYRSDAGARLAVQLADTRRGVTLAAADLSADSLQLLPAAGRAERIVRELMAGASQLSNP
jgi:hypothetical protein